MTIQTDEAVRHLESGKSLASYRGSSKKRDPRTVSHDGECETELEGVHPGRKDMLRGLRQSSSEAWSRETRPNQSDPNSVSIADTRQAIADDRFDSRKSRRTPLLAPQEVIHLESLVAAVDRTGSDGTSGRLFSREPEENGCTRGGASMFEPVSPSLYPFESDNEEHLGQRAHPMSRPLHSMSPNDESAQPCIVERNITDLSAIWNETDEVAYAMARDEADKFLATLGEEIRVKEEDDVVEFDPTGWVPSHRQYLLDEFLAAEIRTESTHKDAASAGGRGSPSVAAQSGLAATEPTLCGHPLIDNFCS